MSASTVGPGAYRMGATPGGQHAGRVVADTSGPGRGASRGPSKLVFHALTHTSKQANKTKEVKGVRKWSPPRRARSAPSRTTGP